MTLYIQLLGHKIDGFPLLRPPCVQVAQFDRALALVDINEPAQRHLKGAYCYYMGCLAETLEICHEYKRAEQTYELLLRTEVRVDKEIRLSYRFPH